MTFKAYFEIDEGHVWAGQATFDVRPERGDSIAYGSGKEAGKAQVKYFEHREQVDGFVFVVCAERVTSTDDYLASLIGAD